jgi:hypothetical protein
MKGERRCIILNFEKFQFSKQIWKVYIFLEFWITKRFQKCDSFKYTFFSEKFQKLSTFSVFHFLKYHGYIFFGKNSRKFQNFRFFMKNHTLCELFSNFQNLSSTGTFFRQHFQKISKFSIFHEKTSHFVNFSRISKISSCLSWCCHLDRSKTSRRIH